MADRKISDLTALTAPASGDFLPIVDISEAAAATKNKRVTIQSLFQGIPVNVGIGTSSPAALMHIYGSGGELLRIESNYGSDGYILFKNTSGSMSAGMGGAADNIYQITDRTNLHVAYQYRGGVSGYQIFAVNGSERLRIDSSGRLLVGTSISTSNAASFTPSIQVAGSGALAAASIARYSGDSFQPQLSLQKSRGGIGTQSLVSANDALGHIAFEGSDGSSFKEAASIKVEVDGTPGGNDMPGRLVFSTTADGAASPTEALRIKSTRIVNIANTPVHADNAAAKTAGLVDGDVYRKSDGTMMIVFT